ncbi:MAG: hypothetical protein JSV86_14475 [Gemmatimonadota bacterium]|nr:MAG: hypothetical protein JSV86_14475 [Gemmatimonadota bacterium]
MRRFVKVFFGCVGAAIAWNLAAPAGAVVSGLAAIIGIAIGVYVANRLYLYIFG